MSYAYPIDSVVTFEADGTPIYDRAVSSETLRKILHVMLTDGVFLERSDNMQVNISEGMFVQVNSGYCVIRGAQKIFETNRTLAVQASSPDYDRIDTVVARLDLNQSVRDIDLYVVKGNPSNSPVRPELTRTSSIWEIGLADIFIAKNTSVITQHRITDTRLESARCGIVSSLLEFDTSTLYNQVQADLNYFRNITEEDMQNWTDETKQQMTNWCALNKQEFEIWFDTIKGQLSGDVAGNLQNEINDLYLLMSLDVNPFVSKTTTEDEDGNITEAFSNGYKIISQKSDEGDLIQRYYNSSDTLLYTHELRMLEDGTVEETFTKH